MGIFERFRKKEITFKPEQLYFDILSSNPIPINDNSYESKILKWYYNIPQLYTIIDYSAKVAAKNEIQFFKNSGKLAPNGHPLLEVLQNPHPLYSEGEFWETLFKQFDLFNIALIYKVSGGFTVSGLFVLPFQITNIIPVNNLKPIDILLASDIREIISHYEINYRNTKYKIPVDDVMMITGSSIRFDKEGFLVPDNRLEPLTPALMNIHANYEARYSLIENRGMMGMWVNQSKDSGGWMPLPEKEKKEANDNIRRQYGLTKGRNIVGITNADLRFESSSLALKDMELQQGIKGDKITLCDAFNFPILLLNESEGSTFANLAIADKLLYTKNIIPKWELFAKSFTREFSDGQGEFKFRIDNIEVLQRDQKQKAETDKINTDIIINLNASINNGQMTYDNAVNYCVQVLGMDEQVSKNVINESTNIIQNI